MDSINNPLHVPEGPITRNKTKKIQEAFTLHVQKLANAQRETENFERKFLYNVSSASQEDNGVKMGRESCVVWKMAHETKKCAKFVKGWQFNFHLLEFLDVKGCQTLPLSGAYYISHI